MSPTEVVDRLHPVVGITREHGPVPLISHRTGVQRKEPNRETSMSTINDDRIERSVDIHWPDGFDPDRADLFAHNAMSSTRRPTESGRNSSQLRLGPPGIPTRATSSSTTFRPAGRGRHLQLDNVRSQDLQHGVRVRPVLRLGWYGNGDQLRAYHTWLLIPRSGHSTYVVMEEIGMGDAAQDLAQTNPGHMHRGHDLWNISLKFICEA